MLKPFIRLAVLFIISVSAYGQSVETKFRQLTIDQGLSQNMVNAICQDHRGFMWFGTKDGLNRYDGYAFKVYKTDPYDADAISDNHVTALYEDDQKNLWIGTRMGGLNLYHAESDSFRRVIGNSPETGALLINSITGNSKSGLWISSGNGYVVGYDIVTDQKGEVRLREKAVLDKNKLGYAVAECLLLDDDGLLWIATQTGLLQFDTLKMTFTRDMEAYQVYSMQKAGEKQRARGESVSPYKTFLSDVVQDQDNIVWLFSNIGVYRLDRKKKMFTLLEVDGWVTSGSVVKNREGVTEIWMPLFSEGLSIVNTATMKIRRIAAANLVESKVLDGVITQVFRSSNGDLWMATNGRGVIYCSPNYNLFGNGLSGLSGAEKMHSNSIYSVYAAKDQQGQTSVMLSTLVDFVGLDSKGRVEVYDHAFFARAIRQDRSGNLWIGTNEGLMIYDKKARRQHPIDTSGAVVSGIYIDSLDRIWYTTPNSLRLHLPRDRTARIFMYDKNLNKNRHHTQEGLYSIIHPDPDGSFWVGTVNGLHRFDPRTETFTAYYENDPANRQSISSNEIKSILPDPARPDRFLWVGTMAGLNRLDKQAGTFEHFGVSSGLPNNTVYGILPDDAGNLWLSTNRGLSLFTIKARAFTNFDVNNGLQSNEFNTGAYFKSDDGELFFGGIGGLNRFYPNDINLSDNSAPIVVSDIQVLGSESMSKKVFSRHDVNRLPHDHNNISITLASLDYSSSGKIRYAYRILNNDTTWIQLGSNRTVSLTNLSPGKYVFQAKGTDSFGRWSDEFTQIAFWVAPPWWRSLWAQMAYMLVLAGGLYSFWTRNRRRIEEKHRLETERRQAAAVLELDRVKSRFLANITHEFRTPLTLISGHIERLKSDGGNEKSWQQYTAMERNSRHLLRLINQLMDLSKMESGEYRLRYKKGYVLEDLKPGVSAFHSYAEQKKIRFSLEITHETEVWLSQNEIVYAPEALDAILKNLLSNACKFAEEEGFICISVHYTPGGRQLKITVANSGPEIPAGDLPKIFDRFFQSDGGHTRGYEGSGIGLALVKELSVLHGGSVSVTSSTGTGTVFTVLLREGDPNDAENLHSVSEQAPDQYHPESESSNESLEDLPLVLIVEDHEELRRFIRESLGNDYRFAEAVNGTEGLLVAEETVPDLIVSDVMMPGMDGFELCRQLKTRETTSHIPVVLLTARATSQDKLEGLETGADDYLTKPFSAKELRVRLHNLIHTRRLLRRKFSTSVVLQPEAMEIREVDKTFLSRLIQVAGDRLADPALDVETLAGSMHLSQSQLNRKLKALTGQTAVVFIRNQRMARSLEMLRAGADNISEVAYAVGFDNPGYFSTVFKKHFGFAPSDVSTREGDPSSHS